jgi:hypothetical protein
MCASNAVGCGSVVLISELWISELWISGTGLQELTLRKRVLQEIVEKLGLKQVHAANGQT